MTLKRKSPKKTAVSKNRAISRKYPTSSLRAIQSKFSNANRKKSDKRSNNTEVLTQENIANQKTINKQEKSFESTRLIAQSDNLEKKRLEMEKSLALMLQKRSINPELPNKDDIEEFDAHFTDLDPEKSLKKQVQENLEIEKLKQELSEKKEALAREKEANAIAWNKIEAERDRLEMQRIELEKRTVAFAKKLEKQDEIEEGRSVHSIKRRAKYEVDVTAKKVANSAAKDVNSHISMIKGAISTKIDKMQQFMDIDFTDVKTDIDSLKSEISDLKSYLKKLLADQLESKLDYENQQTISDPKLLYSYDDEGFDDEDSVFNIFDQEKIAGKKTIFSILFNQNGMVQIKNAL